MKIHEGKSQSIHTGFLRALEDYMTDRFHDFVCLRFILLSTVFHSYHTCQLSSHYFTQQPLLSKFTTTFISPPVSSFACVTGLD